MYAKVINGKIIKYPYTFADIKEDNPNTSFPSDMIGVEAFGIVTIFASDKPDVNYSQEVIEVEPEFVDGCWKQKWVTVNLPSNQVAEIAKELRTTAYKLESDPIFFKWQRGEATQQEWFDAVNNIKNRYPE